MSAACLPPVMLAAPPSSRQHPTLRLADGVSSAVCDTLIEELPVALIYNGISHTVLLATPEALPELALGFSLSEGILHHPGELYDCEVHLGAHGISIAMDIASARFAALKERRRSLAGRTGCGLCGVESLQQVARTLPPLTLRPTLRADAVARALAALPAQQPLFAATGAAHAAAFCNADGDILLAREDVGRHNALDKLIGALAHAGIKPGDGFALVSSRASYEMVQKTASAGIAALVALSAPTAYAAELAERCGLLLAGFARQQRLSVYSQHARLYHPVTENCR